MFKKLLFFSIILMATITFSQEKSIGKLSATPKPFPGTTVISFNSSNQQNVLIIVKNILGKTVFKKQLEAKKGSNKVPLYRKHLKSGMYIYALQNSNDFISKRFVIR